VSYSAVALCLHTVGLVSQLKDARQEERRATTRVARPLRRMYSLKYSLAVIAVDRYPSTLYMNHRGRDENQWRSTENKRKDSWRLQSYLFNYFVSYVFYVRTARGVREPERQRQKEGRERGSKRR